MNKLLDSALQAHGGLDRWSRLDKVSAMIVSGGGLLPMKGIEPPSPLPATAAIATTREQRPRSQTSAVARRADLKGHDWRGCRAGHSFPRLDPRLAAARGY